MRGLVVVVGLAVALSTVSPARAAERGRVLYAGLRTLGVSDAERSGLEAELAERLSENVGTALEIDVDVAGTCGRDPSCYCAASKTHGAARAVFGTVGRIEERATMELVLVEAGTCSVESTAYASEVVDREGARRRLGELLDQLVTPGESVAESASKGARDVGDAPANVVVFTGKQLRDFGITRLEELLRLVPGFEVDDRNDGDHVLRHGLGGTVLYMMDGVPLTSPLANVTGTSDVRISLEHIARVEIVKNPASTLWGGNALLGIVHVVTKDAAGEGERAELRTTVGTQETAEASGALSAARPAFSYYVGGTATTTRGPVTIVDDSVFGRFGLDAPVFGNAGATDNGRDWYLQGIAKANLFERVDLLVDVRRWRDEWEISPYGALLPASARGFWDRQDILYRVSTGGALAAGITTRLTVSRYEHRVFERFAVYPPSPRAFPAGVASVQGNETAPAATHTADVRVLYDGDLLVAQNHALLGLTLEERSAPEQFLTDTDGTTTQPRVLDIPHRGQSTISPYISDELSFLDGWVTLAGGLRLDAFLEPVPIYALVKQAALLVGPEPWRAKLVYAEGTRPPATTDLYSTNYVLGNPNLRPEESRSLSLEGTAQPFDFLRLSALGEGVQILQLIAFDPDGLEQRPTNVGEIDVLAASVDARLSLPPWTDVFIGYSFKHLIDQTPVERPRFFTPHTLSFGASVRPLAGINLYATGSAASERAVWVLDVDGTERPARTPMWATFDVGATVHQVLDVFDVTLEARNPLGLEHRVPYTSHEATEILERRHDAELMLTVAAHLDVLDLADRLLPDQEPD